MEFDNPRARKSNRIRIPDAIALFHGTAKTLDRKFHHVHVKYNEENNQLPNVKRKTHGSSTSWWGQEMYIMEMFPAGIEPATLCLWGARDNHYTTETLL